MATVFRGGDFVAMMFGGAIESVDTPSAPTVSGTPTELDIELLDDVFDIIEEFGATVTFWVCAAETYSPETGKQSTSEALQYAKKVIPPYDVELRYVDGDLIHVGDLFTGVAAKNIEFTPRKKMKVTIGEKIWTILNVREVKSGNRICLYLLQLRR